MYNKIYNKKTNKNYELLNIIVTFQIFRNKKNKYFNQAYRQIINYFNRLLYISNMFLTSLLGKINNKK